MKDKAMTQKTTQRLKKVTVSNIDFSKIKQAFYIKSGDGAVWRDKNIQQTLVSHDTGPTTLWITFYNDEIWWYLNGMRVENSSCDWNDTSMAGGSLRITRLNKRLTGFKDRRETVSAIKGAALSYLLRILQGEDLPEIKELTKHENALTLSVQKLIERLTWEDFDTLVHGVLNHGFGQDAFKFSDSPGTSRMTFWAPVSGQLVHTQVNYVATQKSLDEYVRACKGYPNTDFYIYQSTKQKLHCDHFKVDCVGPDRLAEKVAKNSPLLHWLMDVVNRSY